MTNSADPDQKPTDLDLHRLLRQGMLCSALEGLRSTQGSSSSSVKHHSETYIIKNTDEQSKTEILFFRKVRFALLRCIK